MSWIDQIENDSVICFLGDSITANGLWISEVFAYLQTHYREKHLKLYNCGISGDDSTACVKRVYKDCLCFSPDYVVLMLGMNDIHVELYKKSDEESIRKRQIHIDVYKKNMSDLVKILANNRVKIILCTPTICGSIPNGRADVGDFTAGLEACATFVRDTAERNGYPLIDFQKAMWDYANLEKHIISEDCVHPTEYGYHIMAQLFMVQMGIKQDVCLEDYSETNLCNKARFETEKIIRDTLFCEHAMQWEGVDISHMTIAERKEWIQKNATLDRASYWTKTRTENYLNAVDYRERYIGQLIEQTNAMYLDPLNDSL